MREKTYTFRHKRCVIGDENSLETVLGGHLLEDCLSRGYIPAEIRIRRIQATGFTKEGYPVYDELRPFDAKTYKLAECYCAYAGKKTAKIIYEKNGAIKLPTSITFTPPSSHKEELSTETRESL